MADPRIAEAREQGRARREAAAVRMMLELGIPAPEVAEMLADARRRGREAAAVASSEEQK